MTQKYELMTTEQAKELKAKYDEAFPLHQHQKDALAALGDTISSGCLLYGVPAPALTGKMVEQLHDHRAYRTHIEGQWLGDENYDSMERKVLGRSLFVQQFGRGGKTKIVEDVLARRSKSMLPLMADMAFQATRGLREASAVIWDEIVFDSDLPFTSKEHTPFCRNVRVWDAKGFSPAVELCNRHPDLLVADDWLRATTFDLYAMAIKTSQSYYADLNIDHIKAIKWWVKYLKEVQAYEFSDTAAPAKVYCGYRSENDMRGLFKRRSNDDSPKRQYINVVINWRARSGRV